MEPGVKTRYQHDALASDTHAKDGNYPYIVPKHPPHVLFSAARGEGDGEKRGRFAPLEVDYLV